MSELKRRIDHALGRSPADLVLKGGRFLDLTSGALTEGDVAVSGERIVGTCAEYSGAREIDARGKVIVPGFIDTHLHVESSMVAPAEFDRCTLPRGTTTAICDPHEISNVLGEAGLTYFLESALAVAGDLRVQLSSCVPATDLETSGARLTAEALVRHKNHPKVIGLAEFMNYPGIFHHDPEVLAKLEAFQGEHIDGHCPLVCGKELNAYAACGIRNCHESTTLPEAREKLTKGMNVLIREGSVSKDLDALYPLLHEAWPFVALCSDDRNPLDIAEEGHLDYLIRHAIARGIPAVNAYRAASWSAAQAFGLRDRGLVAPGYRADLVLLDDLDACAVHSVISAGRTVDEALFAAREGLPAPIGRGSIHLPPVTADVFAVKAGPHTRSVIGVQPGKIITEHLRLEVPTREGLTVADPARDLAKVCVLSRHGTNANVGRGFLSGFGLRAGALAGSIGHDSHNVITIGVDDGDMAVAVNHLIELEGGLVVVKGGQVLASLGLPLAGLMSDRPFEELVEPLRQLRQAAKELGCELPDPFLQMAFLPLPVIPHLKITDHGLIDVDRFEVVAA